MRLQAAPELGDFFAPDGVKPTFRLNLDQQMTDRPRAESWPGIHINPAVLTEFRDLNAFKARPLKQVTNEQLEPSWIQRQ